MTVAFDEVVEKISDAARRVETDEGASPVLVAVVREFQVKLAKAQKQSSEALPIVTTSWSWNRPAIAQRLPPKPTRECRATRANRWSRRTSQSA